MSSSGGVGVTPTDASSQDGLSYMNMSSRVRHSLPRASSQGRLFFEHLSLPMQTTVESQFKNFFKVGLIPNTFHVGRNTLFDPLQPVRGDVVVYSYVPDAVIVHLFCQGRLTFGVICIASPTMTVAGLVHRMRVAYGGTYHVRDGIDGDRLIRDFFGRAICLDWNPAEGFNEIPVHIEFAQNVVPVIQDSSVGDTALMFRLQEYYRNLMGQMPNLLLNADDVYSSVYTLRFALSMADYIVQIQLPEGGPRRLFLHLRGGGRKRNGGELRHFMIPDDELTMMLSAWLRSKVTDGECSEFTDLPISQLFEPNPTIARLSVRFEKRLHVSESDEYRKLLYSRQFIDNGSIPLMLRYVHLVHNSYVDDELLSPYFAIIQCSGTGKTRMVIEAAKGGSVKSLYLLCREAQGCLPSPLIQAAERYLMRKAASSDLLRKMTGWFERKLWLALCKLSSVWAGNQRAGRRRQVDNTQSIEKVLSGIYTNETERLCQVEFWRDIIAEDEVPMGSSQESNLELPESLEFYPDVPIVIVFDEGKGLNALSTSLLNDRQFTSLDGYEEHLIFRAVRQALQTLSAKLNADRAIVFSGIFLDTNSSVANFLPPVKHDPSNRPIPYDRNRGKPLCCPYEYLANFDLTYDERESVVGLISGRQRDANARLKMLSYGRPLWKSMMTANEQRLIDRSPAIQEDAFFKDALAKLNHGPNVVGSNSLLHRMIPIAARISPRLSGTTALSSEMVEDYMGIMYFCSGDRNHMRVEYREEPAIGTVFGNYMIKQPQVARNSLHALRDYMVEVGGDTGFHGEFSAQLLALASMDHASKGKPHIGCTLREFFNAMVGPNFPLPRGLGRARIAFTQFVKTQSKRIGKWHVSRAIHFGYAISTSHTNKGYNMLIPFEMPNGEIACLLVEVKNHKPGENARSAPRPSAKTFTKLREQINIISARYPRSFGVILALGQFQAAPMIWRVDAEGPTHDIDIEFDVTDSNSWRNPVAALEAMRAASQSLYIQESILGPQSDHALIRERFRNAQAFRDAKKNHIIHTMMHEEPDSEPDESGHSSPGSPPPPPPSPSPSSKSPRKPASPNKPKSKSPPSKSKLIPAKRVSVKSTNIKSK